MNFQNDDDNIKDLDELIHAFALIGNLLDGSKISPQLEFLYNAEGLAKKILHHIITARVLFKGYQYDRYEPQIDFSPIAVLTRCAWESYLTFHYVFVAPQSQDEKNFKLQCWYLGGLERIKYKPAFADNIEKWEEENILSNELKAKIESTDFFKNLPPNRQKDILNGQWKLDGWFKLATDAGFNESFFRQQYMFLSAYSHSNRLSIIQIQQITGLENQKRHAQAFIGILSLIIAKFAYDYVEIMPGLKEKVDWQHPHYKIVIEYKQISELMNRFQN